MVLLLLRVDRPTYEKGAPTRDALRKPGRVCWKAYRFENWKLRRAFALPYFLRSTTRGSRVRKPAPFSAGRRGGSNDISARMMPRRTAPACPDRPPPVTES